MTKGPKPQLTPAVTERIVREMALGLHLGSAAQRCGLAARTVQQWYQNGRAGKGSYVAFAAAVQKAESDREQRLLAVIDAACKPDKQGRVSWQAAAWKLERLHPERWARPPQRVVVTTPPENTAPTPRADLIAAAMAVVKRGHKSGG